MYLFFQEDWTKYDDRILECINKNDVQRLK